MINPSKGLTKIEIGSMFTATKDFTPVNGNYGKAKKRNLEKNDVVLYLGLSQKIMGQRWYEMLHPELGVVKLAGGELRWNFDEVSKG